ncbi:sensor of ECF-type sigma factor [uncultured Polaribacter sp.]|uniref:sensor of ECF-type sigma factor n=1 Tax=uncultured Polaribacter sp. TaxID=174711 RepID=UPI0026035815|nr:sensor of ECF-type sigma factor [uncultured Polaribacter sp.]
MKKTITCICLYLFCTLTFLAQEKKESREKIRALKIAYITEQLNLNSSEAEKFWPIYNVYDKNQHVLRNELRSNLKNEISTDGIDAISEKKAEALINLKLKIYKKIYQSDEDFLSKIKKVISYKKILKLQIAEMEFGRKLMRRYKGKRKK